MCGHTDQSKAQQRGDWGRGRHGIKAVTLSSRGGAWSPPLVEGDPMGGKGQALPQLVPLPGHHPQLHGQALQLLIQLPLAEHRRRGRRLPGGACRRKVTEGTCFRPAPTSSRAPSWALSWRPLLTPTFPGGSGYNPLSQMTPPSQRARGKAGTRAQADWLQHPLPGPWLRTLGVPLSLPNLALAPPGWPSLISASLPAPLPPAVTLFWAKGPA